MELAQPSEDLARSHVREAVAEGDDLRGDLGARSMRNALRRTGAINQASDAIQIVPREPLVQSPPAHAVPRGHSVMV